MSDIVGDREVEKGGLGKGLVTGIKYRFLQALGRGASFLIQSGLGRLHVKMYLIAQRLSALFSQGYSLPVNIEGADFRIQ